MPTIAPQLAEVAQLPIPARANPVVMAGLVPGIRTKLVRESF